MRQYTLILALGVAILPTAASAADCDETREKLSSELELRFKPDDPAALERRDRIKTLFLVATPACSKELHEQLGESDTGDELSHAFHYALATPTRATLRKVLADNFVPLDLLDAAIEDKVSGAAERDQLHCWIGKLREGSREVDGRVIEWRRICPQSSATCPTHTDVTDASLADQIHSADDVEQLEPEKLMLFTFVNNIVETETLGGKPSPGLAQWLAVIRKETAETRRQVEDGKLGGPYDAIAEWISGKRDDPKSVLSCL